MENLFQKHKVLKVCITVLVDSELKKTMVHLILGELKNDGYMFIKSVVFLIISVREKYILELWLSQKSIKGYLKMRCFFRSP